MSDAGSSNGATVQVAIIMGSDSDWPVMQAAAAVCEEFGVPYEAEVVSAHRMPREMVVYASSAESRGLRVIIAGAGGAAHLPGMVASLTPLPVIGVPVPLKALDGMDSLLSIVQMPAGIPVATVGIGPNHVRLGTCLPIRRGLCGRTHVCRGDERLSRARSH